MATTAADLTQRWPLPPAVATAFPPTRADALARADAADPRTYARTRNHLRGAVTRLSPYLTHGLVSVPDVLARIGPNAGKLAQELAWREYFQLVHAHEGAGIFVDRRGPQPRTVPGRAAGWLPRALIEARTGVAALDDAVRALHETGYVHNHARMRLASVTCHLAGADWRSGARWFFHHLLDGDLASNALSWQWVAGSDARRPYLADQANLNTFADTVDAATFLDRPRDRLLRDPVPEVLRDGVVPDLRTALPDLPAVRVDEALPLHVYHPWALDPTWRADDRAERWLLLERPLFERHPISATRVAWIAAAAAAIPDLRVVVGDARDLLAPRHRAALAGHAAPLRYRAHPAVAHWPGVGDPPPTAFAQRWTRAEAPRSFSAFWRVVGVDGQR